jgi:hypothetical protein
VWRSWRQWTRRLKPQTGQVATPETGSSARKLAQPLVEQNRRLWLARRIRRAELARVARPPVARIARVDIMSTFVPWPCPDWCGASADVPLGTVEHRPERKSEPARRGSWAGETNCQTNCQRSDLRPQHGVLRRNHGAEHLFCQMTHLDARAEDGSQGRLPRPCPSLNSLVTAVPFAGIHGAVWARVFHLHGEIRERMRPHTRIPPSASLPC